ncbi:MAG: serine/threonine protein kinase, partial [Planctomycetota bacterium]|nr:serine/threonine protein kinase [Planctomycetota bacterium]
LLIDPAGRVLVTDFGLARLTDSASLTSTDAIVGTPKYMSPEQILPGSAPLDGRTDIYSLAATLYQLLTGRPPFEAPSVQAYIRAILEERAASPRKFNKQVPHDLATIVLRCLEKSPADRYQSAAELADDLERFLAGERIVAKPKGVAALGFEWLRRHRLVASLATIAIIATVLILMIGGKLDTTEEIVRIRQMDDPFAAVVAAEELARDRPRDDEVNQLLRDMHGHRADALLNRSGADPQAIMDDLKRAGRERGFWYLYLLADVDPTAVRAAVKDLDKNSPLRPLINGYLNLAAGDYDTPRFALKDLTFRDRRLRAFQHFVLGHAYRGLADLFETDEFFAETADMDRRGYLEQARRYLQDARTAGGDAVEALLRNRIAFEEAAVRNALSPNEDSIKIITDLVNDIGARLRWSREQLTGFAGTGAQSKVARAFVDRVLRMAGLGNEVLTGSSLEAFARARIQKTTGRDRAVANLLLAVAMLSQGRATTAATALGEIPLTEASLLPYAAWTESLVYLAQGDLPKAISSARNAIDSARRVQDFNEFQLLSEYTTLLAEEAQGKGLDEDARLFAAFLKSFLEDLPGGSKAPWSTDLLKRLAGLLTG